jgi:hypothetical protein
MIARLNSGALTVSTPPAATATGAAGRLGDLGASLSKANASIASVGHVAPAPAAPAAAHLRTSATTTVASTATTAVTTTPVTTATSGTAFQQAVATLVEQISAPPAPGVQWVSANLDGIAQALSTSLHPQQTIEASLVARLGGVTRPPGVDPLDPVMPAPTFPQAMYSALAEQSQSWIVPGLDQVPDDTVATLTTNWPFVEAFLVGLNHEMARKLLWNGYPTDQRGTYFSRFWDIRSRTDGTTTGDVGPITQWQAALGGNRAAGTDPLVLLVRGELVRRYPNVVVYAAQAVVQDGARQPGPTELHPLFFAGLDPDVALFGFALDPAVARGDPGWFFCLQEHPSEPRFGLAVAGAAWGAQPASWDVLGWDHLAASAQALSSIRYVDLDAALPQNPPAADATGAVWHAAGTPGTRAADLAHITFRRPQRLAIHASRLIPAPSTP